jgi:hypothetical protein
VGVLRAVVEVPVLAMFHPRKYLLLRGPIAFQLVRDDHPRYVGQSLQQLAEELLGRFLVSAALHENIQDVAILIDGPPQILARTVDREEHFVQVPLVAWSGTPPPELVSALLAKFPAPLTDGLICDDHSPFEEELFDIAIAEAEAKVESDAVANDFRGKAVVFVWVGWYGGVHGSSQNSPLVMKRAHSSPEERCLGDEYATPCWGCTEGYG